jgi:hypothetical protein
MRGSDRCDEIVKLIDETLGGAQDVRRAPAPAPATCVSPRPSPTPRPTPRRQAGWPAPFPRTRTPSATSSGAVGEERQQLLAAVEAFLAGTLADVA